MREAANAYAAKQPPASVRGVPRERRDRSSPSARGPSGRSSCGASAACRTCTSGSLHAPDAVDGAAQRPRRLHPAAGGRLDLGRPGRPTSPPAARTSATRSSTRPPTRSTATRPSTTCPRMWSTCDRRRSPAVDSLAARTFSVSPTMPWSTRSVWGSGSPAPRRSRRTWRWPTSASTCWARRAHCWPGWASSTARPVRGRPGLLPRRARVPQRPARRAGVQAGSASRWPACCGSRPTSASCTPRCVPPPTGPRRRGGQGAQGGRLPPRPRDAVGAAAGGWHAGVPCPDAGGPRRGRAVCRRALRGRRASAAPAASGLGVLPSSLRPATAAWVRDVVDQATLAWPDDRWRARGGRDGVTLAPHGLPAGRDAAHRPLAPGGDLVTASMTKSPCGPSHRGHPGPGGAGCHHRGPRHPAPPRGRRGGRHVVVRSRPRTPAARRWRPSNAASSTRRPPPASRARCSCALTPGVDHRLDDRAGPAAAAGVRDRPSGGSGRGPG